MLDKVKVALRLKTNVYDEELQDLIKACIDDMQITDIFNVEETEPLIIRAVITYCKMNFGEVDSAKYDRLLRAYNEMKSQLSMNSRFTNWNGGSPYMEVDNALSLTSENPVQNKVITAALNGVQAQADDNTTRLNNVGNIINGLSGDIEAAQTDIDNIESAQTALGSRVGTVENGLTAANANIETLNEAIGGAEEDITTISGALSAVDTRLLAEEQKTAALESDNTQNKIDITQIKTDNVISAPRRPETQITGYTSITQGQPITVDLSGVENTYHKSTILVYIRKGTNRRFTKFELTKEELLKMFQKSNSDPANPHAVDILRVVGGLTSANGLAYVKQTLYRPVQSAEGLGQIELTYNVYENGTQVTVLDNFEYVMWGE